MTHHDSLQTATHAAHQPVLLSDVMQHLQIKTNGYYVDGTYGRGGHSGAILEALGPDGHLLALDRDPEAVAVAEKTWHDEPRAQVMHRPFSQMKAAIHEAWGEQPVDGVLLDLGVSSPQLDQAERGFSFRQDGPLDMRMDPSQGEPASAWLNRAHETDIADVLYTLGEERKSRRIASVIVQQRPITTTLQLAQCVLKATGRQPGRKHPATRTFQAIRMHVNQELEEIQSCLQQSLDALASGGRLVVMAFHSIEDRVVKHFMRDHARANDGGPLLKRCAKVLPTRDDVQQNRRARSVVLRVAEKC